MMNNWTADFQILAADENGNRLVYLDSAATTPSRCWTPW